MSSDLIGFNTTTSEFSGIKSDEDITRSMNMLIGFSNCINLILVFFVNTCIFSRRVKYNISLCVLTSLCKHRPQIFSTNIIVLQLKRHKLKHIEFYGFLRHSQKSMMHA